MANAIKEGRPGGVYYTEHWHYAVAWRYRKTTTQYFLGGTVYETWITRQFRINTGWGAGEGEDAVWNACDIDGCCLINIFQRRLPPP